MRAALYRVLIRRSSHEVISYALQYLFICLSVHMDDQVRSASTICMSSSPECGGRGCAVLESKPCAFVDKFACLSFECTPLSSSPFSNVSRQKPPLIDTEAGTIIETVGLEPVDHVKDKNSAAAPFIPGRDTSMVELVEHAVASSVTSTGMQSQNAFFSTTLLC